MALQPHPRARPRPLHRRAPLRTDRRARRARPGRRSTGASDAAARLGDLPEHADALGVAAPRPGRRPDRGRRPGRRARSPSRSSSATTGPADGVGGRHPPGGRRSGEAQRRHRRGAVRRRRGRAGAPGHHGRRRSAAPRPATPACSGSTPPAGPSAPSTSPRTRRPTSPPRWPASEATTPGSAPTAASSGRGASGQLRRRLLRRRRPDPRLPHLPGARRARHHEQPAVQGRRSATAHGPCTPASSASAKDARGTNAFQTNRNIKLSEDAWAESVPNLQIENNDVHCSHASAVGPDRRGAALLPREPGRAHPRRRAADRRRVLRRGVRRASRSTTARILDAAVGRQAHGGAGRMTVRIASAPLDELQEGKAHRVEAGGHVIALVRLGDDVYAIGDRCSHQDISLSEGDVLADERTLECWKHGSGFSLETGEPTSLPATRPVPGVRGARRRRRGGGGGRERAVPSTCSRSAACAPAWPARRSSRASTSPSAPVRCTPSWARTAPARAPCPT